MKKLAKYLLAMVLVLLLTALCGLPALAADASVTFRGLDEGFSFAPGSGYTETDLFAGFKDVMPGDVLQETVTVVNKSEDSDYIKLYLRATPHDENGNPLTYSEAFEAADGNDQSAVNGQRDETVAAMQDFLAQLTLTVKNGDAVIYQASPDKANGLENPILLATLRYDETQKLDLTLQVPTTLGNQYANRVGEVDWVFLAELFNDPPVIPDPPDPPESPEEPHNVIVNKVWNDNGHVRPESITVHLLRDGVVYDTVTLNAAGNWSYAWANMDPGFSWTVEEEVPAGYTASYSVDASGTVTTVVNTGIPIDPIIPVDPVIPKRSLTVQKVWIDEDDTNRPASVSVVLLRNDAQHAEVVLSSDNNWTHTWTDLSAAYSWSISEIDVPENYTASYEYNAAGDTVTVTNTRKPDDVEPTVPPTTALTLEKHWVDDGTCRPDAITVDLLRSGVCVETVTVTAEDNWIYTWDSLDAAYSWSVVEHACDGYLAEYSVAGTVTVITNTYIAPKEPLRLTVRKNWDITYGAEHPDTVEITLYNGETAVETVLLGAWNQWAYTWDDLDADGNWRVLEDKIPLGYTPSYSVKDSVVTITNTQTLIQTGQLNWPIPVLAGLGCMILGIGILLVAKKKDQQNGT